MNLPSTQQNTLAELFEAGLEHMLAGRFLDAQQYCQQALSIEPGHADSLHLMGLLAFQAEQYDHAVAWMIQAIRSDPKPDYLLNFGTTLTRQGRHEEAFKTFDKAIQLQPENAELWAKLGSSLVELKRPDEALLSFQQALKLNPRHCDAAYHNGILLHELERYEEALNQFDLCEELRPDHVPTLQARGRALRRLKRFGECLAVVERAHMLAPSDPINCNNMANALRGLGRLDEGLLWLDKALALQPGSLPIHFHKAFALIDVRRFAEAFDLYDRIESLDPENAEARFHRSHLRLLTGDFAAGWPERESRWKVHGLPIIHPPSSLPIWRGDQDIANKNLLLYGDEGLGDSIQFARYVPMAIERGARVSLSVLEALHPLMSRLPGITECRTHSSNLPFAFDMCCPLMSLPLAFGTTVGSIPAANYLPAPEVDQTGVWETRLGRRDRLRVGLVWSGNPKHPNDHDRSIALRKMARLLDINATFVSLQKDPRPDDARFLRTQTDVVDLTALLSDLAETAALISCLDLVITVDTSVAHLAATLGRPTWILLPYVPDWRWLLDRDDSPWYPTARLYRQTETRDYDDVLERVRTDLTEFVASAS